MRAEEHIWFGLPPQAREYVRRTLAAAMEAMVASAAHGDLAAAIDEALASRELPTAGEGVLAESLDLSMRYGQKLHLDMARDRRQATSEQILTEALRAAIAVLSERTP